MGMTVFEAFSSLSLLMITQLHISSYVNLVVKYSTAKVKLCILKNTVPFKNKYIYTLLLSKFWLFPSELH